MLPLKGSFGEEILTKISRFQKKSGFHNTV